MKAAQYLHADFKRTLAWTHSNQPLVILLAIRGSTFGLVDPIYAATDTTVLFERPRLLESYTRDDDAAEESDDDEQTDRTGGEGAGI